MAGKEGDARLTPHPWDRWYVEDHKAEAIAEKVGAVQRARTQAERARHDVEHWTAAEKNAYDRLVELVGADMAARYLAGEPVAIGGTANTPEAKP